MGCGRGLASDRRAATGTTTGGSSNTGPGRGASSRRATAPTATTGTATTSRSCATTGSARTGSRSSGRASSPRTASSRSPRSTTTGACSRACHEQGVQPVVTFHHFSNPRWLAALGGWESPEVVDRFTRYCERTVAHLGDLVSIGCTINEPNILALMGYVVGAFPPGKLQRHRARTSRSNDNLIARAPRAPTTCSRRARRLPARHLRRDGRLVGARRAREDVLTRARHSHEEPVPGRGAGRRLRRSAGVFTDAASTTTGILGPEPGVEVVPSMGYEFWPQALEVALRFAAETAQTPLYVTENGLGHDDDSKRIAYVARGPRRRRPLPRRRARRARLLLLVAARQLRVGPWVRAPVRSGRGHPGHLRAHAQAVGGLAGRHRPGEPPGLIWRD